MHECNAEDHFRGGGAWQRLADCEELLILSPYQSCDVLHICVCEAVRAWKHTVCSSTHFAPKCPCPSTNRRYRIWKCTGGPPKAVKPRSHIRAVTSARRHASVDLGVFDCEDEVAWRMRRKEERVA
jgi:hypothetical protein